MAIHANNVTGSSTSTGSFGHILKDGINWETAVSASASTIGFSGDVFSYISGSNPVWYTNPSNLGALWFNTASAEIFVATDVTTDENTWVGTGGTKVQAIFGSRGVFGGGSTASYLNVIDYVTIATPGDATDFGDLTVARDKLGSCSDGAKGLWGGGYTGADSNVIDYVTIATTGNAIDFGDLTVARYGLGSCSDATKGVWGGGNSSSNVIDYVTIATTGNATDFGNLSVARWTSAACSGN